MAPFKWREQDCVKSEDQGTQTEISWIKQLGRNVRGRNESSSFKESTSKEISLIQPFPSITSMDSWSKVNFSDKKWPKYLSNRYQRVLFFIFSGKIFKKDLKVDCIFKNKMKSNKGTKTNFAFPENKHKNDDCLQKKNHKNMTSFRLSIVDTSMFINTFF